VDVALVSDVQGVHLGGGSLPTERVRSLLPHGVWIGVSRHDAPGIAAASTEGADYAFLGTIYRTSSHPGVEGLGTAGFTEAVRRSGEVPVLAIGGIGSGNVREVMAAGAYGVAAIRGIWDAPEPGAAVRRYLEELGQRRGEQ
jgi:thiamine-phosphate diphosphorylase